ncbi:MAG: hypothetical protein DMD82_13755 [Candidatus Rokuibacteriota bacterium]|nr:MAG: hypothetical protein DMD82_13755 [Candidatus Rokubacteria bacterium]
MSLPRVHIHLTVSDLAKSQAFYSRLFGAPVKEKPGYAKFLPEFGPVNLALTEGRPAAGGAVNARVKAAGLSVREEIGVT